MIENCLCFVLRVGEEAALVVGCASCSCWLHKYKEVFSFWLGGRKYDRSEMLK